MSEVTIKRYAATVRYETSDLYCHMVWAESEEAAIAIALKLFHEKHTAKCINPRVEKCEDTTPKPMTLEDLKKIQRN